MRVPGQLEDVADFLGRVDKLALTHLHAGFRQDPRRLERFLKKYQRETGASVPAGVDADAFNPEAYDVEVQRTAALRVALPSVTDCAKLLFQMNWRFFIAKRSSPFIVSDHPFCMVNLREPEMPSGLGSKHIQVSLPLTRRVALFAAWQLDEPSRVFASSELVASINVRTAMSASRFVAAPNPIFPGSEQILAAWQWERAEGNHEVHGQSA